MRLIHKHVRRSGWRSGSRCPRSLGFAAHRHAGAARSRARCGAAPCGSSCCTTSPGRSTRSATSSARRRFDVDDHSTNVFWLAPLSMGESWHHNHHTFPRSAFHGLKSLGDRPDRLGDPRDAAREARLERGRDHARAPAPEARVATASGDDAARRHLRRVHGQRRDDRHLGGVHPVEAGRPRGVQGDDRAVPAVHGRGRAGRHAADRADPQPPLQRGRDPRRRAALLPAAAAPAARADARGAGRGPASSSARSTARWTSP